jgi:hypothetical protein
VAPCLRDIQRIILTFIRLQQPAWGRSREFEITTRSVGRNGMLQSTTGDLEDEEEEEVDEALVHGRKKRKVAFMPSLGAQHVIFVCNSSQAQVKRVCCPFFTQIPHTRSITAVIGCG